LATSSKYCWHGKTCHQTELVKPVTTWVLFGLSASHDIFDDDTGGKSKIREKCSEFSFDPLSIYEFTPATFIDIMHSGKNYT
jgi:hypothetical protein